MNYTFAKALAPEGVSEEWRPYAELRRLYRLARWLLRFSPLVGLDATLLQAALKRNLAALDAVYTGVVLDISGTTRWHRGEYALATKVAAQLAAWGLTAKLAIAPTIGAAWAFSRYGAGERFQSTIEVIYSEGLSEALASLPLQALRLLPQTQHELEELGIVTIADVMRLPRKALALRFGGEALRRLEQALGERPEGMETVTQPHLFEQRQDFEVPLERGEEIEIALYDLFEALFLTLQRNQRRAHSYCIQFECRTQERDVVVVEREVTLLYAAQTPSEQHGHAVLTSLLQPVIEGLHPPGPVHLIKIRAMSSERSTDEQCDFLEKMRAYCRGAVEELLNHYVARLGRENVRQITLHASYLPEHAFSYRPIEQLLQPAELSPLVPTERPAQLFSPQQIEVMALLPDHPPSLLQWRGHRSRVVTGHGPEKICGPWWGEQPAKERDYFKVQEESGRWLWIFRERGKWFVQGIFS